RFVVDGDGGENVTVALLLDELEQGLKTMQDAERIRRAQLRFFGGDGQVVGFVFLHRLDGKAFVLELNNEGRGFRNAGESDVGTIGKAGLETLEGVLHPGFAVSFDQDTK